jgi:hypothetical protein
MAHFNFLTFCCRPKKQSIKWMRRSYEHQWDSSQKEEWTSYPDVEINIIEKAYQNQEQEALLDNYRINFQHLVQISNNNTNDQCRVKRVVEGERETKLRKERFMSEPIHSSKSFAKISIRNDFVFAVENYFNLD